MYNGLLRKQIRTSGRFLFEERRTLSCPSATTTNASDAAKDEVVYRRVSESD